MDAGFLAELLQGIGPACAVIVLLETPALVYLFRLYVKTVNQHRCASEETQRALAAMVDLLSGRHRQ